ncbi:MAG TPA: hypothetical protein VFJ16_20895 [Longimicrobium sp.]|nr:hypothetical protein [Longimicrobium sp.]
MSQEQKPQDTDAAELSDESLEEVAGGTYEPPPGCPPPFLPEDLTTF